MLLTRCIRRRTVVALGAALGFVLLYEGTILDSNDAVRRFTAPRPVASPEEDAQLRFTVTAYCKGTTTASGAAVRRGIAAADPALLPVGSVVRIDAEDSRYGGVYTIMDTGPLVQGRRLDLYMWSCHEALRFGRQRLDLEVLRLGWSPGSGDPSRTRQLFHRRERDVLTTTAAITPSARADQAQ